MEAPGLAKAAAADADPRGSPQETPDGAPAHVPGPEAPEPEPPAYRLQDFDTLATVGECDARGPGPQGRAAPPGTPASDKGVVCSRPAACGEGPAGSRLLGVPGPGCPCAQGPPGAPRLGRLPLGPPRVPHLRALCPASPEAPCLDLPARPPPTTDLGVWEPREG